MMVVVRYSERILMPLSRECKGRGMGGKIMFYTEKGTLRPPGPTGVENSLIFNKERRGRSKNTKPGTLVFLHIIHTRMPGLLLLCSWVARLAPHSPEYWPAGLAALLLPPGRRDREKSGRGFIFHFPRSAGPFNFPSRTRWAGDRARAC